MTTHAKNQSPRIVTIPAASIELTDGEHYAGLIVGKNGEGSYHLILLPIEAERVTFEQANEWAEKSGGALPTRREQALLYANLKEQFEPSWYWSGERPASASGYAWIQYFLRGYQDGLTTTAHLRARAVRRSPI